MQIRNRFEIRRVLCRDGGVKPTLFFPLRLARAQYALRLLLAILGMIAGHYVMEFIFAHLPPHPAHWERVVLPKLNPFFWLAYTFFFVGLPRLRDIGIRWYFSPVLCVPLVGPACLLGMLFIPSDYFRKAPAATDAGAPAS